MREVGVDEAHDYEEEGFSLARATASRAPFDLAVDCVGTARTERSAIDLLKYGVGRYVTLHGDLGKHIASERGMVYGAMRGLGEYARKATFHALATRRRVRASRHAFRSGRDDRYRAFSREW